MVCMAGCAGQRPVPEPPPPQDAKAAFDRHCQQRSPQDEAVADAVGCAIGNALIGGITTIIELQTRDAKQRVQEAYIEITGGPKKAQHRVCLKPAYPSKDTATVIRPVTNPSFFLGEPWECL